MSHTKICHNKKLVTLTGKKQVKEYPNGGMVRCVGEIERDQVTSSRDHGHVTRVRRLIT